MDDIHWLFILSAVLAGASLIVSTLGVVFAIFVGMGFFRRQQLKKELVQDALEQASERIREQTVFEATQVAAKEFLDRYVQEEEFQQQIAREVKNKARNRADSEGNENEPFGE